MPFDPACWVPLRRHFVSYAIMGLLAPSFCAAQTQIPQTITFGKLPDVNAMEPPFAVSATALPSNLPVTFAASPAAVCTVSGMTVSIVAKGTCVITATQAGNATYGSASATQSFAVTDSFPGVDAVIGLGSLITGNHTDYKVNSSANVLEGNLVGRASPQLLAGLAFQLLLPGLRSTKNFPTVPQPWHAFVSLKFATSASQTITGYTFGITFRVQRYLDLLAGYALTPFSEPSPGFTKAAVIAAAQGPTLPGYQGFIAPALNNNIAGAFDGFPLQKQGPNGSTGTNLYAGDPLETRYRGGFMLGISVPLSLNGLIGIPKAK